MKATASIQRVLMVCALSLVALPALTQFRIDPFLRDSCLVPPGLRVVDVIDATESAVGQVYHGPTGAYVNAHLPPSTKVWVRDALDCAPGEIQEDIVLRLTRVSLAESFNGVAVRAGAYVDLEVLQHTGDDWLLLYRATSMAVSDAPFEDAERHGRHLTNALNDCLRAYATAKAEGKLLDSSFVVSEADVAAGRALGSYRSRYPILTRAQLPKGVFRSASAFNNGIVEPVADSSFRLDERGNIHLQGDLKKERDQLWGVSDGTRYHVRLGRKFVPITFDGTQFVGTVIRSSYTAQEQAALGFMFGAVGVLITLPSVEHVPARLDLASGQLLPMDVYYDDAPVDHIIHFSRFADANSSIMVAHGDGTIVLERDTYCTLQFPLSTASELVRITGPGGDVELALSVGLIGSSLHLIDLDENGAPIVKKVNEQMEQSLRARLKVAMLRPRAEP